MAQYHSNFTKLGPSDSEGRFRRGSGGGTSLSKETGPGEGGHISGIEDQEQDAKTCMLIRRGEEEPYEFVASPIEVFDFIPEPRHDEVAKGKRRRGFATAVGRGDNLGKCFLRADPHDLEIPNSLCQRRSTPLSSVILFFSLYVHSALHGGPQERCRAPGGSKGTCIAESGGRV